MKNDFKLIGEAYSKLLQKERMYNEGMNYSEREMEEKQAEISPFQSDAVNAAMDKFTSLDAVELEDFLKAASAYFAEEGDSGVFDDLSILFGKAAKRWHSREGN